MTADLSALIARLEAAEAVTHEVEVEFAAFMYAHPAMFDGMVNYDPGLWAERNASPLSSLDAALALAERVLPGWSFGLHGEIGGGALATLEQPDVDLGGGVIASPGLAGLDQFEGEASTPALALVIAVLRAKAQEG